MTAGPFPRKAGVSNDIGRSHYPDRQRIANRAVSW